MREDAYFVGWVGFAPPDRLLARFFKRVKYKLSVPAVDVVEHS